MDSTRKGRRLEIKVAAAIRRKGLDPHARRMPRSGAIEHLKADVLSELPYSMECKNQERVEFWAWWEEAWARARMGRPAVLVISANHRPILAVMELDTFLNLCASEKELLSPSPKE